VDKTDTATPKYHFKIHTNTFRSLTAGVEEDTNETSQQSGKWWIFHKNDPGTQNIKAKNGSLKNECLKTDILCSLVFHHYCFQVAITFGQLFFTKSLNKGTEL